MSVCISCSRANAGRIVSHRINQFEGVNKSNIRENNGWKWILNKFVQIYYKYPRWVYVFYLTLSHTRKLNINRHQSANNLWMMRASQRCSGGAEHCQQALLNVRMYVHMWIWVIGRLVKFEFTPHYTKPK